MDEDDEPLLPDIPEEEAVQAEGSVEEEEVPLQIFDDDVEMAQMVAADVIIDMARQKQYTSAKPKGSKMKRSSEIPSDKSQRVQRLQRSYIVRNVQSRYPTEIYGAVNNDPPPALPDNMAEPLKSFLAILKTHMGVDPSAINFNAVEDRIMRSTKAEDESDSEHYQRLMSALNILNGIKQSRVSTLRALVEMGQKDLNEDRQHKRFSDAIQIKRDKADSEITKETADTHLLAQDLLMK